MIFAPAHESAPGLLDLRILPALRRVLALVVAVQQKHDFLPVSVAEDPEQDSVMLRRQLVLAEQAELKQDLLGALCQAELEDPTAHLAPETGPADANTQALENVLHGLSERFPLQRGEILLDPGEDRAVILIRLTEELKFVPAAVRLRSCHRAGLYEPLVLLFGGGQPPGFQLAISRRRTIA